MSETYTYRCSGCCCVYTVGDQLLLPTEGFARLENAVCSSCAAHYTVWRGLSPRELKRIPCKMPELVVCEWSDTSRALEALGELHPTCDQQGVEKLLQPGQLVFADDDSRRFRHARKVLRNGTIKVEVTKRKVRPELQTDWLELWLRYEELLDDEEHFVGTAADTGGPLTEKVTTIGPHVGPNRRFDLALQCCPRCESVGTISADPAKRPLRCPCGGEFIELE